MSDKKSLLVMTDEMTAKAFASYLVDEMCKIFNAQEASKGQDYARTLIAYMVSGIIASSIHRALISKPPGEITKQEAYDYVSGNFKQMKVSIQEAVAVGFEVAMMEYTKQPVEYYCQVKTVPNQMNQKVC